MPHSGYSRWVCRRRVCPTLGTHGGYVGGGYALEPGVAVERLGGGEAGVERVELRTVADLAVQRRQRRRHSETSK